MLGARDVRQRILCRALTSIERVQSGKCRVVGRFLSHPDAAAGPTGFLKYIQHREAEGRDCAVDPSNGLCAGTVLVRVLVAGPRPVWVQ